MSTVRVYPVTSRKDQKRFIDFGYTHYDGDANWIPMLRSEIVKILNPSKNAFFEHGKIQPFLAENSKGEVVGRIAAIINGMHLKKYNDANGFFGFFECIEDYSVAETLLDTAKDWLKQEGMQGMRGPANPSLNDIAGLLVDGFERKPSVMMPYNPPYYISFLEQYGFERAMTMWAYFIHFKYLQLDKMRRGMKLLQRRYPDVHLRTIDMSRFEEEAQTIMDIYNDAWSNNWGHVPMTQNEFKQLAADLKQIIDPNVVFLLEEKGVPIAFSVSLPNINQALEHIPNGRLLPTGLFQLLLRAKFGGINELRTLLMGVRKSHQGRGFDTILNLAIMEAGPANGYPCSEMSWVLDSNPRMIHALEDFGGVKDKEYAMVELKFV